MGALTRDPEFLGDVGNGTTMADHPLNEQTPTMQIQTSISVGHEGLLASEDGTSPLSREVLPIHKPRVTNVPAEYT
jgi:hypothetical protein